MRGPGSGAALPLLVLLLAIVPVAAGAAQPATIGLDAYAMRGAGGEPGGTRHVLQIDGDVGPGDAARVRGLLDSVPVPEGERQPVIADVSGEAGDIGEAMAIGRLLHERGVPTLVRRGRSCRAACALIALGGARPEEALAGGIATGGGLATTPDRRLEIGGILDLSGVLPAPQHSGADAATPDAADRTVAPTTAMARAFAGARATMAAVVGYGAAVSLRAEAIGRLLEPAGSPGGRVSTAGQFLEAGVCPVGTPPRPPRPELQALNICNHAMGEAGMADPSRVMPIPKREAARHMLLAVHERLRRNNENSPLAAQLWQVLQGRDDRLVARVYADLAATGIALPKLEQRTYEVVGYEGGWHCHVSLAPGVAEPFATVIVGPGPLARGRPPPASCPFLVRYDPADILNPER